MTSLVFRVRFRVFPVFLIWLGLFAATAASQEHSEDSSVAVISARNNAWVSAGVGVGASSGFTAGPVATASGWYSYNQFVAGAHAGIQAQWFGPEVKEHSYLIGIRDLGKHEVLLIAAGPAALSGDGYKPTSGRVPRTETGVAVVAQAIATLPMIGIGFDAFLVRGRHRSVHGVTLSLQLGWFGR